MARLPAYQRRSMYARTNSNFLVNGPPDGWVVTNGPMPWGAVDDGSPPVWWQGSDRWGGPIGPHGPWLSGKNSMLPSITRCTDIIAGSIVRAPWKLTDPKGNLQDRPNWLIDPMLIGTSPGTPFPQEAPGRRLDRLSFWSTWITHALWWGLGAFICEEKILGYQATDEDGNGLGPIYGEPKAGTFRLINPFLVGQDEDGFWVIDPNGETPITTDWYGRFSLNGRTVRLMVLRGMPPNDGAAPEGVLVRHFQTLRIGASVSQYVADMFASGGIPSGLLKVSTPGLKKAEADALKASWMEAHGTSKRSVAVLNATVEYQPVTLTPVDANVVELMHASKADVAHAFNMSSIWLDEGASGLTYQNSTDRRRDLLDLTLAAPAGKVGAVLSSLLPYGWELSKDFTGFTQSTFEESIPVLTQAVQAGLMTAQEARQRLGLAAETGPDPSWRDNSPATKDPQPVPPALAQFAEDQGQEVDPNA